MKKLILSLVAIATLSISSFGQAPEGFKYQAVVRDAGNLILNNQAVGMQLTIQQGSIGGTAVYTETFSPTSNAYGLVNIEIGSGSTTDDFSTIDWSAGPYFIETAIDINGGTSYVIMGTSQLMSVPYALYAKTSGNGAGPQGPAGANGLDGADGIDGTTGAPGTAGTNGIDGTDGATGSTGPTGPQGPIGLTGATGPAGSDGTNGTNGTDGNDGAVGATGPAGATGPQGATGATGPQGMIGLTGSDGTNGINGTDGAVGATGATGAQGIPGNDGAIGPAGATGSQGPTGLTGATGTQGAQGPAGADGTNGTNGNDGAVGATGLTGPAGANGTDGVDGIDGATGPAGANGLDSITIDNMISQQISVNVDNSDSLYTESLTCSYTTIAASDTVSLPYIPGRALFISSGSLSNYTQTGNSANLKIIDENGNPILYKVLGTWHHSQYKTSGVSGSLSGSGGSAYAWYVDIISKNINQINIYAEFTTTTSLQYPWTFSIKY